MRLDPTRISDGDGIGDGSAGKEETEQAKLAYQAAPRATTLLPNPLPRPVRHSVLMQDASDFVS